MSDESIPKFEETEELPPSWDDTHELDENGQPVSRLESFGRGVQQGTTLGFGDEIGGAAQAGLDSTQALLNKIGMAPPSPSQVGADLAAQGITGDIGPESTGDMYREGRDENRALNDAAAKANPLTYLGGNITGGMLTGAGAGIIGGTAAKVMAPLGQTAKNATLVTKMGQGAVNVLPTAAIAGLGSSNADLTKGEFDKARKDLIRIDDVGGVPVPAGDIPMAMTMGAALPVAGKAIQGVKNTDTVQDLLASYEKAKNGIKLSGDEALTNAQRKLEDLVLNARQGLSKFGLDKGTAKNELIKNSDARADMREAVASFRNNLKENSGVLNDQDNKILQSIMNDSEQVLGQGSQRAGVKSKIDTLMKNESFTPENTANMDKNVAREGIESDLLGKDFDLEGFVNKTFDDLSNGKQLSESQQSTLQQLQRQYRQAPLDSNAQNVEKVVKKISSAYDNLSPQGRRVVLDYKNKLLKEQNVMVPEVAPLNADISDNLAASEALLGRSNLDKMTPDEIPKFLDKNAKQFQKYDTDVPGTKLNINNILNEGLPTEAGGKTRSLKELNPDFANPFERDLAEGSSTFNLSKKANTPVATDSMWGAVTGGINKSAVKIGEGAGANVASAKDVVRRGADWLSSAERPQLVQAANEMATRGGKAGIYYAHQLLEAANKNPSQRNTLIFSLMQQPAFRKMLHQSETEADSGTENDE